MQSYKDRLKRESKRWASFANDPAENLTWVDSPTVMRHVNRMIAGDEKTSWFDVFRPTYLPQEKWGGVGLNLGCNHGMLDRQIMQAGLCAAFDASDVSEGSIEVAREEAAKAGLNINYEVADANHVELEENRYTLIIISMALHHFERLEHVFEQMNRALRPDGILIFNEFVGPTRFQWTDEQLYAINTLRNTLPESFRRTKSGQLLGDVERPDLAHFIKTDPFESIRSAEIMPLAREYMDVVEERPYGGTILHMLFHRILHNFDETNPLHVAMIEMLCKTEQLLIEGRALPSDFVTVAVKKKAR
jgi:ubiquinone/menaquinone biosynthesis C-methylase UbiE